MKKTSIILVACSLMLLSTKTSYASIVTIKKDGVVEKKILGLSTASDVLNTPEPKELEVKNVYEGDTINEVKLAKANDKVSLSLGDKETFDVTSVKDNIIEVEEKAKVKSVKVALKDNKFVIAQEGLTAVTDFPISIDPLKNTFKLATPTGEKYLKVFPFEALQGVYRAKVIAALTDNNVDLIEENKDLSYSFKGKRIVNLFNVMTLDVPVTVKVSASTGEIASIDQPKWLSILNFLFV